MGCLRNRKSNSVSRIQWKAEEKTKDEAGKRSKDQMMKGTRIHNEKLGFYSKILFSVMESHGGKGEKVRSRLGVLVRDNVNREERKSLIMGYIWGL